MGKLALANLVALLSAGQVWAMGDAEMLSIYSERACASLLETTFHRIETQPTMVPRRFPWQDRALRRELLGYRAISPKHAAFVLPEVRAGDKDIYLGSNMLRRELGYVLVLLEDGEVQVEFIEGRPAHLGVKIGAVLSSIAKLLLRLEEEHRVGQIARLIHVHAHPYLAAAELGIDAVPEQFSDGDLYGFNRIKAFLEAHHLMFPVQFEIIYRDFETGLGLHVAKKGIFYDGTLRLDWRNVCFGPGKDEQILDAEMYEGIAEQTAHLPVRARIQRLIWKDPSISK